MTRSVRIDGVYPTNIGGLGKIQTGSVGAPQDDVAACFDYYAGLAQNLDDRQWQPLDVGDEDFKTELRREPLGPCALITPWNYPLLMAAVRKIGISAPIFNSE
jgi:acyl-CoA reductase-like NAD-dependent aldehyde dehydrogenase